MIYRPQAKNIAKQLEICVEMWNHSFFLGNMWSKNIANNIGDLCKNKKTGKTGSKKNWKNVGDSCKNEDFAFVAGFLRKLRKNEDPKVEQAKTVGNIGKAIKT